MSGGLRIRVIDVQRATARVFGLPVAALTGPVILRSVTWPRHVAVAVAAELTDKTWEEISRRFNRDPAIVRHALIVVRERTRRGGPAADEVARVRLEARGEAQRFADEMRGIARDAEAEARERAMLAQLPAANSGRAA